MRTVDPVSWPRLAVRRRRRRRTSVEKGSSPPPAAPAGPTVAEARLRYSVRAALRDYCRHCSVGGLARALDGRLPATARCEHLAVWAACVCWAACAVWARAAAWRAAPALQLQASTLQRSVRRLPAPALAVCSAATLAAGALHTFTRPLVSLAPPNSSYSGEYIRSQLLQLGALVTLERAAPDLAFVELLAQLDPGLSVDNLMLNLSVPCSALVVRCWWRGRELPCAELFRARTTPLGDCCLFNARYYEEDSHLQPRYLDLVGPRYGLTVLVRQDPGDYGHVRRASAGADVLLFEGSEYPLLEGGGARLIPLEPNTSLFMSVSAVTQRPLRPPVPGCQPRNHHTSYVRCLVWCRRRTVGALCSCRPHTLPPLHSDRLPVCSLANLPCLNKHREKLIYYYPGGDLSGLEEEQQNGQDCPECLPDCERLRYSATTSLVRHHHPQGRKLFRSQISEGVSLVNMTLVRLYYSSEHQKLLSVEPYSRWYETFVALAGSCAGIAGVSLAAASELLYHLTVRAHHHHARQPHARRARPHV